MSRAKRHFVRLIDGQSPAERAQGAADEARRRDEARMADFRRLLTAVENEARELAASKATLARALAGRADVEFQMEDGSQVRPRGLEHLLKAGRDLDFLLDKIDRRHILEAELSFCSHLWMPATLPMTK
jgi:hypothetical protein